ncbi:MAG: bifunctional phosphopantothenoylcysteine decarboxylase/phosphopantothenate--cysteine ligase CoaBC [Gammaproteobacteria bacterium]
MPLLAGKRILLGITGGIAAYKAADLTRRLQEVGAEVQVVMTPAATAFIAPLTLQALSGRPVRLELLDPAAEAGMGHIELARWADLILVAPASADFIARLAHGFADDLLATLCLASDKPIALAPAMNRLMWQNPATQDNGRLLERRGVALWGPASGGQACGEVGEGRMLEPLELRDHVVRLFAGSDALAGARVLITAGPTREAIDPVRYISNHSSGRMGYAVAQAAVRAGAQVTLVSGPVELAAPAGVERIAVESAQDMHAAVMARAANAQVFIAVAAVADYRVAAVAPHKLKKNSESMTLDLVRNPDILGAVAALDRRPFCVGFAAETEQVVEHARAKFKAKRLDMIAANQVGGAGSGFGAGQNALHVLWKNGEKVLPMSTKAELATALIALIAERYHVENRA